MRGTYRRFYILITIFLLSYVALFFATLPWLSTFIQRNTEQEIIKNEANFLLMQVFIRQLKWVEETLTWAGDERLIRGISAPSVPVFSRIFPGQEKILLLSPNLMTLYQSPSLEDSLLNSYLIHQWASLVVKEGVFREMFRQEEAMYFVVGSKVPANVPNYQAILFRWISFPAFSEFLQTGNTDLRIAFSPHLGKFFRKADSVSFFEAEGKLMGQVPIAGHTGSAIAYLQFTTKKGMSFGLLRIGESVLLFALAEGVLFGAFFALLFSHWFIHPMNRLLEQIRHISVPMKRFSPFSEGGPWELRQVSRALNLLLRQWHTSTEQLKARKEELELLLQIGELWWKKILVEEALSGTLHLLHQRANFACGAIFLPSADEKTLHRKAQIGWPPEEGTELPRQIPSSQGLEGMAMQSGAPVVVDDYPAHPRKLFPMPPDWKYYVAVPIIAEVPSEGALRPVPQYLGVLAIWDKNASIMERSSVEFLNAVGKYLGNFLLTSQLHSRTQLLAKMVELCFRAVPVGIFIEDAEQTLTYVNPELCRLVSYEIEELLGKPRNKILKILDRLSLGLGESQDYLVELISRLQTQKRKQAKIFHIGDGQKIGIILPEEGS